MVRDVSTPIPRDVVAVADYAAHARQCLGEQAWAYFAGGAGDEHTLRDNEAAFARLRLDPRVLTGFDGAHTRVELFGEVLAHPILLAPVALQKLAHADGELASVRGAGALSAAMVVSTESSVAIETLAAAATTPLWFQLYLQADRGFTRALVERAEAAGCRALVLTVDAPINGVRDRERRAGLQLPSGVEPVHLRGCAPATASEALFGSALLAGAPTWADVDALRTWTRLPIVLKGILGADDARRALKHGADGLVVSNHGGRTLDGLPATIDALTDVAAAVDGRVPILLDGGIRRGTDVLKAIALGARAVMVGRPYVHGLAVAGAAGVAHVVQMLRSELEAAMVLCGRRTLAEVERTLIRAPAPR